MPVSAADLVKKLMAKANVTFDGDYAAIPDDIAGSLDNSLLTIAAATNNHPDVKKVYFAQAYNGLDAELKSLATEFSLPDDVIADIEKAGGSTKKAVAMAKKLHELASKAAPADKTEAAKLRTEITELNNKLATEIKKQTDLKADFDKQLQGIKIQTKLSSMLNGHKTVYDELPVEAKDAAINALITKALQDSDADFTFDDKGNLSLIKKDGTNLFGENHTLVTPQSFIDKTLSKILKVSTPGQPGGVQTIPAAAVPGGQNPKNAALDAAIDDALKSYETGVKQAVAI